jgi:hypothetical protein
MRVDGRRAIAGRAANPLADFGMPQKSHDQRWGMRLRARFRDNFACKFDEVKNPSREANPLAGEAKFG